VQAAGDALSKLSEQAYRAQDWHAGFHGPFIPAFLHSKPFGNPARKLPCRASFGQNIPQGPVYFAEFAVYITQQ
jgi:hypothetical protein